MPPVPKVIFARPGRMQPWPTSDACWSPAMPAIGGAPGEPVASPTTPVESTTRAAPTRGMLSASSSAVVPVATRRRATAR